MLISDNNKRIAEIVDFGAIDFYNFDFPAKPQSQQRKKN